MPGRYAGCATSRRVSRCALPERKATDSKPETEECPPRLRLSALCLWKASSRGEGPFCHLYAARDAAVGCVPRVTYFTASVYRPPTAPLRPLRAHNPYVGARVVCERPRALRPSFGEAVRRRMLLFVSAISQSVGHC
ncbi:hypothetical protein MTO96_030256 [Rhipicephalus appendiculatus]